MTVSCEAVEEVEIRSDDGESGRECTLRVSVQDNGIGIPSDKQALIFDSFSQV